MHQLSKDELGQLLSNAVISLLKSKLQYQKDD